MVIFASDHGDYLGDFALVGKTTFHEPSVRVPLVVRTPGAAPAVEDAPVSLVDLPATILSLCGVPAGAMDGRPLAEADPERIVVGMTALGVMARSATHKLVRYANGVEALFDLRADPGEQAPITDEAVRRRLDAALVEALVSGTLAGHADKRVPAAQSDTPGPFHRRGWVRPYPAPART